MNRKIYFRADAGVDIGYGHFTRTLALADMLKDDFECTFYTVCPTPYQIEEMRKVCKHVSLETDTFFNDFLELLTGDEIVVLDNYFYTTAYQQRIKEKGCCLVCIDDVHDKHYVADVVINHGMVNRNKFSGETWTRYCLGLKWALLREPFLKIKQEAISNKQDNIIVCMGGADPFNLNRLILEHLFGRIGDKKLVVILGIASEIVETEFPGVKFYRNLSASNIVDLFQQSKVGIFSSSTVCIEALVMGMTIYAGYYVDNQKEFYHYLTGNHYVYGLGNLLSSSFSMPEKLDFISPFDRSIMYGIKERYIQLFEKL
ncbi:UDP-2,4-diacetamido-2,4,6-trideoxy-beta-L-altropyranose hydrolase [Butyricimonas virosa]|mgnify:FL=1|uniref:UDP-2,4-diacetamido-2,4, 6-trideoxy-beta-L-altropyranose hydrolase n=1 Tax=Butyricimonas virosa TaxID=544645 RepID=A0A412X1W1_9BACT|nr:UDP-2,4-diacetamido-2,4,6-trideoxy-beta-L-altropyranose hydrolase [Butyricimonas virosa]RGV34349.1 UDP-2,4-diacetamido-2,4,6-trideoxy-beta-L-altropyranose hydrolase [Butyricimonas virosa]